MAPGRGEGVGQRFVRFGRWPLGGAERPMQGQNPLTGAWTEEDVFLLEGGADAEAPEFGVGLEV